jgi:hypothetical protein
VDLPALLDDELAQLLGDRPVVADPGGRHPQRGDPAHVRLVRPHARRVELVVLDAVGVAAADELLHPRQLVGLGGDHELAGTWWGRSCVRQNATVSAHRRRPAAPSARRGVVEPGVDDVGVAPVWWVASRGSRSTTATERPERAAA